MLADRHCWGFKDSELPDRSQLDEVAGFAHATLTDCPVTLWRSRATGQHWVSFPRPSWRQDDGAVGYSKVGRVVREWCPVTEYQAQSFGEDIRGRGKCGACGYDSWTEFAGMADGICDKCGYRG